MGSLNVYSRERSILSAKPIWSMEKNQGDQWRAAAVTVKANEAFEIVFEGVVGSDYYGDIAIGELKFYFRHSLFHSYNDKMKMKFFIFLKTISMWTLRILVRRSPHVHLKTRYACGIEKARATLTF